jgi:hypothetical protein
MWQSQQSGDVDEVHEQVVAAATRYATIAACASLG